MYVHEFCVIVFCLNININRYMQKIFEICVDCIDITTIYLIVNIDVLIYQLQFNVYYVEFTIDFFDKILYCNFVVFKKKFHFVC